PVALSFTNGVSSGNALVLYRAETAHVSATDGSVTATGAGRLTVAVAPASAARLALTTDAGSPQTAGTAFSVTITALDAYGNTATAYTGGVAFTSTDPQAAPSAGLPVDYTFAPGDNGTHAFGGIVLKRAGA